MNDLIWILIWNFCDLDFPSCHAILDTMLDRLNRCPASDNLDLIIAQVQSIDERLSDDDPDIEEIRDMINYLRLNWRNMNGD